MADKIQSLQPSDSTFGISSVSDGESTASNVLTNSKETNESITLLKEALDMSVEKCLSALSDGLFNKHFKTVRSNDPRRLRNLRKELTEQLRANIKLEMESILAEHDLEPKLRILDELKVKNRGAPLAWRPSGVPTKDLRAHLIPEKQRQKLIYEQMLKPVRSKLQESESLLKTRREFLQKKLGIVNEKLQYFKNNAQICAESTTTRTKEMVINTDSCEKD